MNSTLKRSLNLTKSDLKISLRRSESLLVTAILPIMVLIALSFTDGGVDKYMPFVFVQSSIASALLSLGITTGFDRRYRVLVRLGTTPIGKQGVVVSKIIYVFVLETIQLAIIGIVGLCLGYNLSFKFLWALPFCWLASISFASIALIIASLLKAETNLGVQNLTYIICIGIASTAFVDKSDTTDFWILTKLFPSIALHLLIRYAGGLNDFSLISFLSLVFCALIFTLIAIRTFKFDE